MNKIEHEMRLRQYRLLHYLFQMRERLGITNKRMLQELNMTKRVWVALKQAGRKFSEQGELPKKGAIIPCPGI